MQSERVFDDPVLADVPFVGGYPLLAPCLIFDLIGRGGMGTVFLARHLRLDIDVAVKCMRPELAGRSDSWVLRFRREASLAAQTSHQNLVRAYDVLQWRDLHYIVMEVVRGENGRQRVERVGPLPVEEALAIVAQVAAGLALAHDAGIVHRDVKPENMLISTDGHVKLADLGLAKALESGGTDLATTLHTSTMGTPQYMAPEQWQDTSRVGPAADVYALGASLYFFLSGAEPRPRAALHEFMQRAIHDPLPDIREIRDDVPEELAIFLQYATALDLSARPATARRFLDALIDVGRGHPLATRLAVGHTSWMPHRSRPHAAVLVEAKQAMLAEQGVGARDAHRLEPEAPVVAADTSRRNREPGESRSSHQGASRRFVRWRAPLVLLSGLVIAVAAGMYAMFPESSQPLNLAEQATSSLRMYVPEPTPWQLQELRSRLDRVISVSWDRIPMSDAMVDLAEQLGAQINVPDTDVAEAMSSWSVSFSGSDSILALLDVACGAAHVPWGLDLNGVQIGWGEFPSETVLYDIGPLVALGWDLTDVWSLVRECVARESWDASTEYVVEVTSTGGLIVINTWRVQEQVTDLLNRLIQYSQEREYGAIDTAVDVLSRAMDRSAFVNIPIRHVVQDVASRAHLPLEIRSDASGCLDYVDRPITIELAGGPLGAVLKELRSEIDVHFDSQRHRLVMTDTAAEIFVSEESICPSYLTVVYDIAEIQRAEEANPGSSRTSRDFNLMPSGSDAASYNPEDVSFIQQDELLAFIQDNIKPSSWISDPNRVLMRVPGRLIVIAPLSSHSKIRGVVEMFKRKLRG